MSDLSNLGPLAGLAGTWEGSEGLDVSYSYSAGGTKETPYRERATFEPFGPVDNGQQVLHGLDYRMSAWREGEDDPFHMEIGYWLWDAAAGQVMRCFLVPRGVAIIAGGDAAADASEFRLSAAAGSTAYGVLSNRYLEAKARTEKYELTVRIGDGSWSYQEDTVLSMAGQKDLYHHTDRNTLKRA